MTDVEKLVGARRIAGLNTAALSVLALIFWIVSAPILAGLALIGAVVAVVTMVGLWWMTPDARAPLTRLGLVAPMDA